MNVLEIKVSRSYYVRLVILGVLSFGIGFLLMGFEYRKWIKFMDNNGVTRMDGKSFSWSDLKEVSIVKMRHNAGSPGVYNNTELIFVEGKALIFPLVLDNSREVADYVMKVTGKSIYGSD